MNLPTLPKQNKQREADFGVELRKWLKNHPFERMLFRTCSLELKHTRGSDSFDFREFKPEQQAYASKISGEGELIRVQGLNGEPDYIWMSNEPAYIVIKYPKAFVMIGVNNFIHARDTLKRKSLTYTHAKSIAHRIIHV